MLRRTPEDMILWTSMIAYVLIGNGASFSFFLLLAIGTLNENDNFDQRFNDH